MESLSPLQSYAFLQQNPQAILVDCRSSMEFLFVGHPVGAVHIAWIDEPTWDINPDFVASVRRTIRECAATAALDAEEVPVLIICRSGKRSLDAGKALLLDGFRKVYNVLEGFEGERNDRAQRSTVGGWRFHGLPWEQC